MYLRSLELSGFKSFAKKSDLEFSTAITAIVGPNGSGKSNVAEAFRFVLGEQSIKSMRGKRGEDLIFNGSESVARANRAGVKITLDNRERHFPIDFDEITMERVVYRDGTNEYILNGSRTRLKDIQELLASANIGSTGHHIISQGEADRILSASAKERREMIEDALGLKVFQYKRSESERKLQKTTENIAQVESLRREVAPHLKFLERQVKKIEKSLELKEELKKVYAEYLKREDEYIAFHHDRLGQEENAPKNELAKLERELEAKKQILKEAERDEKSASLISLEEKLRGVREERQGALREMGKVEGQITYLDRRIAEEKKRAAAEKPPVAYERVERAVLAAEQIAEEARVGVDAKVLLHIVEKIVGALRGFLNDVAREGKADTALEADEGSRAELDMEKRRQEKLLADIDQKENGLRKEYDALKASIEAESAQSREAEREVFRIMGRERELREQLSLIARERQGFERDRAEFKRELEEAVSLIGRGATDYFNFMIADEAGAPLAREALLGEERGVQLERRRALEKMKIRLEELGGGGADDVVKEYNEVRERDEFLAREIEDLTRSVASLEALIRELSEELNVRFVDGIEKIAKEFSVFFTLMFGGGSAKLDRVKPKRIRQPAEKKVDTEEGEDAMPEDDEEDEELEEGIEIDVQLPNKRVRGLEMLSGGERALTSIALIFAMSQVNPPPFVILDETDAALDEANSKRYGDMIESLAKRSQLILITHNRETMSRAGVLYGVTMGGDGVSKLLSVKLEEAVEVAK